MLAWCQACVAGTSIGRGEPPMNVPRIHASDSSAAIAVAAPARASQHHHNRVRSRPEVSALRGPKQNFHPSVHSPTRANRIRYDLLGGFSRARLLGSIVYNQEPSDGFAGMAFAVDGIVGMAVLQSLG